MFILRIFRILIAMAAIAAVAASQALFFEIEQQHKSQSELKLSAEARYADWMKQNNCAENPLPCEIYSKQFKEWLSDYEQYQALREQEQNFQYYLYLKKLDEEYFGDLGYDKGGLATLTLFSAVLLILSFAIIFMSEKKPRSIPIKVAHMPSQKVGRKAEKKNKPDAQALIQKATDCAESEPMQAISYLEQVLESSNSKLLLPVLLLCGSLRIKNQIGEKQGREQLKRIMETSPESPEAKKAQSILNSF